MSFKTLQRKATLLLALFLTVGIVLQSCKKDDEVTPIPTISITNSALSGLPGADLSLAASINAPGGLQSVTLLKNGAPLETKTFAGESSANYTYAYKIESLASGSTVNFSLQATDKAGQKSELSLITVTISAIPAKQVVEVKGLLTGNVNWTKDKIYKLVGFVRVGADTTQVANAGATTGTLTIEAGTVIIGDRATKGTLIVQRGSKIIANGTANAPIVFTSERDPGAREPGDWGGLVICGKAINNRAGGSDQLEGGYKAWHGGTDDTDNSGSLKYVRVEYAGVPINPNQEVNSFTFGSVGNGTTMDYLMASYGLDDSFEWFGGSANAKHLIAYRGLDDDFDVDFGFHGNIQFAVGLRGTTQADQSGSNGFEVDNDGQGTAAEPFTSATFANVSIIGAKAAAETSISLQFQNGMHLRRNNKLKIYNTFVTAYPNGVYIDGSTTAANAAKGDLVLKGIVVAGVDKWGDNGFGTGGSVTFTPRGFAIRDIDTATPSNNLLIGTETPSAWFAKQTGNQLLANYTLAGINAGIFNATPNFTINTAATNSLTKGAVALPSGFETANYIGAFNGTTDWTSGWAEYNPDAKNYKQ